MNSFTKRSIAGATARRAERNGTPVVYQEGMTVAEIVLTWRPTRPPGRLYVDAGGSERVSVPAGEDGGKGLFQGKAFKMRDAVYPRPGKEL
jgi:hypothetical protein